MSRDLENEAKELYEKLSNEEKEFMNKNILIPKMKVLLFEFINNFISVREAILGKYKVIQEQIQFLRNKKCPTCGGYLEFKDKKGGYYGKKLGYLGHYKCELKHQFLSTEIPLQYLWNICDIIEEELE